MNSFAALGPFQYVGIAFAGVLLTVAFLFLLLREQKSFLAIDGTRFASEKACNAYDEVFERMNLLYLKDEKNSESSTLGLQVAFLTLLKEKGFQETKTLMKYRDQFIKLSNLLTQESQLAD